MLYQVVEKAFAAGRTNFVLQGGVWFGSLEEARTAASRLAPCTLAHRRFICGTSGASHNGKLNLVEEVELAALHDRMTAVHRLVLASRDPARLQREKELLQQQPKWRNRLSS